MPSAALPATLMPALTGALTCALLHALWQLALVALLAAASFSAMRRHSAAARHAAGMSWLLAMLLAPGATAVLYLMAPATASQMSAAVALIPAPLSAGAAAAPTAGTAMQTVLSGVPHGWPPPRPRCGLPASPSC